MNDKTSMIKITDLNKKSLPQDLTESEAKNVVGGLDWSTQLAIDAMNQAANNMTAISAAATTTNVSMGTSTATMNVGKRFSEGLSSVGR
jgi:hypothetical protein